MTVEQLTIGLIRRGFSASGGAESYLKRLARGVVERGHAVHLFTSGDWPPDEWPFGTVTSVPSRSPRDFADQVAKIQPRSRCDVVLSLERVWRCDVYRAGDGVHQRWLRRRAKFATPWQRVAHSFNRKHRDILRLEASLFAAAGATRVIANSEMVKREITQSYGYPAESIDVVRNGVPLDTFRPSPELRDRHRTALGIERDETVLLFVGSGWERKGLRFAIEAVEASDDPWLRLLVAGHGRESYSRSAKVRFRGAVTDLAALYSAADIFILPTLYDPFSNACLEAMASGLPVITTSANGFAEIVDQNVHGTIVDPAGDMPALQKAIRYWSNAERRASARPTILQRAGGFDISRNVEETLRILLQASASAASTSG
ncbi:MAG: glycosyltransferase family 4 protein [Chthoniobacterales bacterium]